MKKNTKKVLSLLLISVLAMGLIAGCTPNNPAPGPADQQDPGPGDSSAAGERMIRMAVDSTPIVDPGVGVSYASHYAHLNIYDSLVIPASDNSGETWPLVAERWDISEDGLVYTFHLKQGVKFHNGDTVTASDVVFSLNRTLILGEGYAFIFDGIIRDATALDESTVQFTLYEPSGAFLPSLVRLYIMNEAQVMANVNDSHNMFNYGPEYGDYGREWLITNSAGSGPFMLTEVRQQEYVHAVRFDDYHLPWHAEAPTAMRLVVTGDPATLRALLANHELEMTDNWQSPETLDALASIDGVELGRFSFWASQDIHFNNRLAPMDCPDFRRGMASLIDYDQIVATLFPGSNRATGPVHAGMPGANLDLVPYTFDVDKAKEYFSASMYADQLDQFDVEFFAISEVPVQERIGLFIQAAAREAGITVSITQAPYLNLMERYTTIETTPHMATLSEAPKWNDASATLASRYGSGAAGTIQQGEWILSPEYDEMLSQAMKIPDINERHAAYKEIQAHIVEQSFSGFLADITERVAYNASYVHWPAAEMAKQGTINYNVLGYHFWFFDFRITS